MGLDIAFGNKTMRTPVYFKMDAHDQLLLSERVCRQLDHVILSYHPDVQVWRGGKKKQHLSETEVQVTTARVHPVQTVQVLCPS